MSERLNKTIRANILDRMKKNLFQGREDLIIKKRGDIAEKARVRLIGGENAVKNMSQFPRELFNLKYNVTVKAPGAVFDTVTLYFYNGEGSRRAHRDQLTVKSVEERPCPDKTLLLENSSDPLIAEIEQVIKEKEELNKERKEIVAMVAAILDSVQTFKKLREIWPEAEEYIPIEKAAETLALPVPVDKLNSMLTQAKSKSVS